jgi:hypothetical protein
MGLRTNRPHKLRDNSAQINDWDRPNSNILEIVPTRPIKITGLLPMRSESIPHNIPIIFFKI